MRIRVGDKDADNLLDGKTSHGGYYENELSKDDEYSGVELCHRDRQRVGA